MKTVHLSRCLALAGLVVLLSAGCASDPAKAQGPEVLAERLSGLSPAVRPEEAVLVAETAFSYPRQLAREYHSIRPAVMNNVLINLGIHQRGLCYQWADDLTVKLMTLHLQTFEIHRGVAHLNTRHEHSCVVVTGLGQSFTNGIALDAWRYAGRLHWSRVQTDNYEWKEVELTPSYLAELRATAERLESSGK